MIFKWKWKSLRHVQLCESMDYTVHGILQARILEWVAFPFFSRSSNPGIKSRCPALQADSLQAGSQGKRKNTGVGSLFLLQWIFLTQESNWGLLHCRWILYQLSYQGSVLIRRGKFGHRDMKTGSKRLRNDRGRDWIDRSTGQRIPRSAGNHKKPEEERRHSCLEPSEGAWPGWYLGLLASRTEHVISAVLTHPICGTFS